MHCMYCTVPSHEVRLEQVAALPVVLKFSLNMDFYNNNNSCHSRSFFKRNDNDQRKTFYFNIR